MAQTIPDIRVNTTWQSVNTLTGIDIGAPINIQNKTRGVSRIIMAQGTRPAADSTDGAIIDNKDRTVSLAAGALEVWVRCHFATVRAHVEEA